MCFICDMDKRNEENGKLQLDVVAEAASAAVNAVRLDRENRELELLTHVNGLLNTIEELLRDINKLNKYGNDVQLSLNEVQQKQFDNAAKLFGDIDRKETAEILELAGLRTVKIAGELAKRVAGKPEGKASPMKVVEMSPEDLLRTLEEALGARSFDSSELDKSKH